MTRLLSGWMLVVLALVGPLRAEEEQHDAGEKVFTIAEFQAHGVTLATAGAGDVDVGVQLPGEVRPNGDRIAHLAPRFAGIVREVRKNVGDRIRVGDVLAIVESETLAPYEMRAAVEGVVVDKHIAPGEAASRDDAAFIVADLSEVWVEINVYQTALPQVHVGPVRMRAPGSAPDHPPVPDHVRYSRIRSGPKMSAPATPVRSRSFSRAPNPTANSRCATRERSSRPCRTPPQSKPLTSRSPRSGEPWRPTPVSNSC